MKTNLVITDPLAGQEVSIMMTVAAGEAGADLPRDKRPFLLSVGVAGQMPISRSGTFGDMPTLINEAWTAFGVRAQVSEQAAETTVSQPIAEELVAEAVVTPISDADTPSPTVSVTKPVTPKRPVSKLSLF